MYIIMSNRQTAFALLGEIVIFGFYSILPCCAVMSLSFPKRTYITDTANSINLEPESLDHRPSLDGSQHAVSRSRVAAEAYNKLRATLEPRRTLRDLHVAQFGRSSRVPMCVIE